MRDSVPDSLGFRSQIVFVGRPPRSILFTARRLILAPGRMETRSHRR